MMRANTSNRFAEKAIVLGVSGSIAAYKACELASRLVERGARVTPVLTHSARQLVGPASFEAITGQRAIVDMFEGLQNPQVEHIAVATAADLFIVAPATAHLLAQAANGLAGDWLTTALLATRAPILFAPAMNTNMYTHPATQENLARLTARGCHFVGPDAGRLACRTVGPGRLIEPMAILEAALPLLSAERELAGKRVLITSGPTYEAIDPVRYLGNRSSGKMGRALALEALARGAEVTVITGPATEPLPYLADVVAVESAQAMLEAVQARHETAGIVIGAAAVADYRAAEPLPAKRKRGGPAPTIALAENPDIIAWAAAHRKPGQRIVGYAAETENLVDHGQAKRARKGLDLLVANAVGTGAGFGTDTLEATIIGPEGPLFTPATLTKEDVAYRLFNALASSPAI